ncbi:MAG TPA: DEAD/DEAH box helicase [Anaerolineales bacterium]|nr:DEAD/DEAH box helicase [Anaerolineales bacterium]
MASATTTLDRLRFDAQFMKNVVAWEKIAPRPARYAEFPAALDSRLVGALRRRGIAPLYTHQSQSVEAALRGENVVVVTGTASGKTLCYNLPVLHTMLNNADARTLYLFPTKALAQDQAAELSALLSVISDQSSVVGRPSSVVNVRIYDGDTPQSQRAAIRKEAQLLITNPDMLHTGILPHHTRWAQLLTGLRWVVLDELHTYRGVFGSHVANVIRRLRRVCKFYGSNPQFICASATIANPKALAERLIEAPVTLVDNDGSPRAEKHFILYNPPIVDPALGMRRAYTLETKEIASQFIGDGVQTIVFGRARATVEVLLGYVRDAAERLGVESKTVRGYRGGYLPNERREIERGLRDGSVRGVVATNALELGVDIGQLGAAVIAGYPGSIASVWQQAGRAGRRAESSAVVFVASAAPLDQYIALHPKFLFESSPEHALINPDNLAILLHHVRCAAFELPFEAGETFGEIGDQLLEILEEVGEVHRSDAVRWVGQSYPAEGMSLRTSSDDRVVIQDMSEGKPVVIGEVDAARAPSSVHTGAVYLHEGRQFVVERLDWEKRLAEVKAADGLDYYTQASESVTLDVIEVTDADEHGPARKAHGTVLVTAQATNFRKIKRYTHETLGMGVIDLPPREFQTTAYWLWIAPDVAERLMDEGVLLRPNDYGPNWEAQRNAARARDGYRCRECGAVEPTPPPPPQHHVHHLRPFREFGYARGQNENYKLANELDNLITLCPSCHHRVESVQRTVSALGGLANALGNIAPLYLMCDPRDISSLTESRSKETGGPTITFYDQAPEGIGLSGRLYELHDELLRGALDLVRGCPCTDGCPACIGPVGSDGGEVKGLVRRLGEAMT